MNMKYSVCLKTFDNDIIIVKNMSSTDKPYNELWKAKKPVKIRLSVPKESSDSHIIDSIAKETEGKLKGVLKIHFSSTRLFAFWTLKKKTNYALVLSQRF